MDSNFDYTTRDYPTIRRELAVRASRALPEWSDTDSSDFMNVLIDLWAYMGDVMHFYIDRAAREAFLSTATQRESVLALANLYDYTPSSISRARSTVTFENSTAASVFIPSGTVLRGTNEGSTFSFYTTSPLTVSANSSGSVEAYEGEEVENAAVVGDTGTSVSNGNPGQKFTLRHTNIDLSTLSVYVHEAAGAPVRWRRVLRMVDSSATDSVYTATTLADGSTVVQFGNGVNGRIPGRNITISANYATCNGSRGNLPEDAIRTFAGVSVTGVTITGSTPGTGGVDGESIQSMKVTIPHSFRAQERAVSLEDFSDLALGVPGVSKAKAEYDTGTVTLYVVPSQSGYTSLAASVTTLDVPQSLREDVHSAVMPVSILGVSTVSIPSTVTITPVYMNINMSLRDGYVFSQVEASVREKLTALLEFDKVSFGQTLTVGDFYREALKVEGVDWLLITEFNITDDNSLLNGGKFVIDSDKLPRLGRIDISEV